LIDFFQIGATIMLKTYRNIIFQGFRASIWRRSMKKVLIVYFSLTGKTEKMAEYIAEGVRLGGQWSVSRKVSDINAANDLAGYDGYIFGSPTYHRDMADPMKTFLFLVRKANLEGKLAGAFGSYTHL
jgi:flavodoxin